MAKGSDLYEEAKSWLQSAQARQTASGHLRRLGLYVAPDEVCMDALFKIWELVETNPDQEIRNVRSYCSTVMHNVIIETIRGFRRNVPLDIDDDARPTTAGRARRKKTTQITATSPSLNDDASKVVDYSLPGRMRACVEAVGQSPAPTSAVLTYLTLQAFTEKEIDVADLPKPKRGARKSDEARWWPSLHLAHQDPDLFPWMDRQNPAQRQRLRRARQEAEKLWDRSRFFLQAGVVS